MLRALLILYVCALVQATPTFAADRVKEILAKAENTCMALDNGQFDPGDAVKEVDLTGDRQPNKLVDESRFQCSSARSLYCGSGGCSVYAVVGDKSWTFQAEGWRMIHWNGRPILLIARDGGWCGGAGAEVCYEAVNWSSGRMMTVMPSRR